MRVARFVESYFEAWNHHDPVGVADHLTADGIYCDVPETAQRTHDELILHLDEFFAEHRQHYELVGEVLSTRNTLAFQYRILPSRRRGRGKALNGAEFMTLNGDAAMTITDYYELPGDSGPSRVPASPAGDKYAKSGLSAEQMRKYKRRLERVMKAERAYLRSDLTLPRLAETLGCSVNHLSQVINAGFGMSFFNYLNRYRVEHAKQLLAQSEGRGDAVLDVAFTAGFNSNSAFYSAFKRFVGQTPAQYRRSQLE